MKNKIIGLAIILFFSAVKTSAAIEILDQPRQLLRFGIDAERLWYWNDKNGTDLAQVGVVELQSDFVRVAIECGYEREEGVIRPEAYTKILSMMNAMKQANPNVKFFASPRPLDEAYSQAEADAIFGGKVPWMPYPGWIAGLKEVGGTTFNRTKLAKYYADYLNLMAENGFEITYIDWTNEKQLPTAADVLYLYNTIPTLLNAGVKMPKLVGPSTWNYKQGTEYLNSVNMSKGEQLAFEVAATHNTDVTGSPEAFAQAAARLGKEVWNTEMHKWVGIEQGEQVESAVYLWNHINAGFTGIATWLFYGPLNGKDHTMIWSDGTTIRRSVKYEIFKKVVNSVNLGNCIAHRNSHSGLVTSVLRKERRMLVCVQNISELPVQGVNVQLPSGMQFLSFVAATYWDKDSPTVGITTEVTRGLTESQFESDFPAKSLTIFSFEVGGEGDEPTVDQLSVSTDRIDFGQLSLGNEYDGVIELNVENPSTDVTVELTKSSAFMLVSESTIPKASLIWNYPIQVRFIPDEMGNQAATLVVRSGENSMSVSLSGAAGRYFSESFSKSTFIPGAITPDLLNEAYAWNQGWNGEGLAIRSKARIDVVQGAQGNGCLVSPKLNLDTPLQLSFKGRMVKNGTESTYNSKRNFYAILGQDTIYDHKRSGSTLYQNFNVWTATLWGTQADSIRFLGRSTNSDGAMDGMVLGEITLMPATMPTLNIGYASAIDFGSVTSSEVVEWSIPLKGANLNSALMLSPSLGLSLSSTSFSPVGQGLNEAVQGQFVAPSVEGEYAHLITIRGGGFAKPKSLWLRYRVEGNSGVDNVSFRAKCWNNNGRLYIQCDEPSEMSIHGMDGRLLFMRFNAMDEQLQLPAGAYVVCCNGIRKKIIL